MGLTDECDSLLFFENPLVISHQFLSVDASSFKLQISKFIPAVRLLVDFSGEQRLNRYKLNSALFQAVVAQW